MRTRMTLACAATLSIQRSTDIGWRRSRRAASRIEGRGVPTPAFQAAAMPARSLSVKDSATMSAGVWRRSTGSARSSSEAEVVVRMCMAHPAQMPGCERSRFDAPPSVLPDISPTRGGSAPPVQANRAPCGRMPQQGGYVGHGPFHPHQDLLDGRAVEAAAGRSPRGASGGRRRRSRRGRSSG